MIRKRALASGTLVLSILVSGIAWAGSAKGEAPPYVANFSYTPDSRKAPGSGGVTFTVQGAEYVTRASDPWPLSPQFAQLSDALKEDLPELLASKGFSVRGPFDSYDLVPYSDKKQIDFSMIPTLEISPSWDDTKIATESAGFGEKVYHGTGTITVSGKLTIKLQEMVTRELMWTKSIPIVYEFPYDVRFPYFTGATRPFDMTLIRDDMAKGLEQQYPKILETLSNLLDPEEMRVIKRQAQELKRKKGY